MQQWCLKCLQCGKPWYLQDYHCTCWIAWAEMLNDWNHTDTSGTLFLSAVESVFPVVPAVRDNASQVLFDIGQDTDNAAFALLVAGNKKLILIYSCSCAFVTVIEDSSQVNFGFQFAFHAFTHSHGFLYEYIYIYIYIYIPIVLTVTRIWCSFCYVKKIRNNRFPNSFAVCRIRSKATTWTSRRGGKCIENYKSRTRRISSVSWCCMETKSGSKRLCCWCFFAGKWRRNDSLRIQRCESPVVHMHDG
jgi:hypothetical protein